MAKATKFVLGDQVRLKSGGPAMTIRQVLSPSPFAVSEFDEDTRRLQLSLPVVLWFQAERRCLPRRQHRGSEW